MTFVYKLHPKVTGNDRNEHESISLLPRFNTFRKWYRDEQKHEHLQNTFPEVLYHLSYHSNMKQTQPEN